MSCSELRDMLGSVKIGAAISKSISGFPVGATAAVTKSSVSSVGYGFAVPLFRPVQIPLDSTHLLMQLFRLECCSAAVHKFPPLPTDGAATPPVCAPLPWWPASLRFSLLGPQSLTH